MPSLNRRKKEQLAEAINNTISLVDVTEEIVEVIAEQLEPEEVFDEDKLREWAENNGYKKEEE